MAGITTLTVGVLAGGKKPVYATKDETSQIFEVSKTITNFNPLYDVIGGKPPYTHIVSPDITAYGLTFNSSTGELSGTPTSSLSSTNFVFSVRDSINTYSRITSTVGVQIYAKITAAATTTARFFELTRAIVPFTPLSASNGTGVYTYYVSSGTLPPGLTLNPSTGEVTGTATSAQSAADVTFSVKDSFEVVATTTSTVSFTVYTNITASATTTAQFLEVTKVSTLFTPLTATGGSGIYTYSVSPDITAYGLTYNSSNGQLTGTPTSSLSSTDFTFSVVDSLGYAAATTSTVNFTIYTQITATADTSSRIFAMSSAITPFNPLVASGGSGTYTYSVSSGTLPAGLSIAPSTGVVSGTPTSRYPTASVTFRVVDSLGVQATTTSTVSLSIYYAIDYFVVGGGGGGGASNGSFGNGGGGGGAGGVQIGTWPTQNISTSTITIGAAGAGGSVSPSLPAAVGKSGSPTTLVWNSPSPSTVTAGGGGGGAGWTTPAGNAGSGAGSPGSATGGGGGGGVNLRAPTFPTYGGYTPSPGGSGNSPGQPGGTSGSTTGGPPFPSVALGGGGGGGGGTVGAGGNGAAGPNPFSPAYTGVGGTGGTGQAWPYTGATLYAGGGGGGAGKGYPAPGTPAAPGGRGSGGNGASSPANSPVAGVTGIAGAVILVMPTPAYSGTKSGGTATTPGSAPGKTVITWTSPGSYTV